MGFKEILKPRSQRDIEGVIDIENISDKTGKKVEGKPEEFLELTYPTSDIENIINCLNNRFSNDDSTAGLFLLEAEKGLGKSHDLVFVYHLLNSPDVSKNWLNKNGFECSLPQHPVIVIRKVTDSPIDRVWDMVFDALGHDISYLGDSQPGVEHLNDALGDRQMVIILDELERGIQGIDDANKRIKNINFLQMLSEAAARSNNITIFASIYDSSVEPGSTLARVAHESIQFLNNDDKARVVQHRLFEDFDSKDQEKINGIIASYVNKLKRDIPDLDGDDYTTKLKTTYPFSPELMDVLYHRIPTFKNGWQGVRGSLGYLAHQVKSAGEDVDIISVAHSSLKDERNWGHWRDLDPGNSMLPNIKNDYDQLKSIPSLDHIMSVVALYTLSGEEITRGVDEQTLLLNCLYTNLDINEIKKGETTLQKYAPHIQMNEGRMFFSLDENARAKVEYRSLQTTDNDAFDKLEEIILNDVYKDRNAVVLFGAMDEFEDKYSRLSKDRIRAIISPKVLSNKEIHNLMHGKEKRNRILLLEPNDSKAHLLHDENLIQWTKRELAAVKLSTLAPNNTKRNEYERIGRDEHGNCVQRIKQIGFTLLTWERIGNKPADMVFDREKLRDPDKIDVLNFISRNIYDNRFIQEKIEDRLDEIFGLTVGQIEEEFHNTLGFPVITKDTQLPKILREMAHEKIIGLQHASKGSICGDQNDGISDQDLMDAAIKKPWEPQILSPTDDPDEETGIGSTGDYPDISPDDGPTGFPSFPELVDRITTPSTTTKNELKQVVAGKLLERENDVVKKVLMRIFFEKDTGELSDLDAALRGGLTGAGKLTSEITIEKVGAFSKVDVEEFIDKLPSYTDSAFYTCELDIVKAVIE